MDLAPHWKSMLRGKKLLLFDFDGTVADTTPLHAAAFHRVLKPYGVEVDYSSIAGLTTLDAMHICLESAGLHLQSGQLAALVQEKQRIVRTMITGELKPNPGVDRFLSWAHPRFELSMVTSGSRATVELALRALRYQKLFEPLICGEDVCKGKPDPEGYLKALNSKAVLAAEALVFEDSSAGISAARRAKIECCDVSKSPGFLGCFLTERGSN